MTIEAHPNLWACPIRWFFSALLGMPLVALLDMDGEINVRLVRRDALGRPSAHRHSCGLRTVILLPNGDVGNGCYVVGWRLLRGSVFA